MKALLLDNYDSFTFNLYQLLADIAGQPPVVATNDGLTWQEFRQLGVDAVVISPGPGNPLRERDFGICRRVIQDGGLPTLGVCLGHQGIATAFGGTVVRAPEPIHGRVATVYHTGLELFESLPQGFRAVRYHSLMVARPLPDDLEEIATTPDGIVMALRHRTRPLWGVQFHPESICTEHGRKLLCNFAGLADRAGRPRSTRSHRLADVRRAVPAPAPPDRRSCKRSGWCVSSRRIPSYPSAEGTFRALFSDDVAAFWLDSSLPGPGTARFSFMGNASGPHAALIRYFGPDKDLRVRQDGCDVAVKAPLFDFLKSWLAERACVAPGLPFGFTGGLVGYFGYELKDECGGERRHHAGTPDCSLLFADRFLAFDHRERAVHAVCVGRDTEMSEAETWFDHVERMLARVPPTDDRLEPGSRNHIVFVPDQSRDEYMASVGTCLEHIRDGESYEICLTTQLRACTTTDPLAYYRTLRRMNPAPYAAFLKMPDLTVASSSPECFLRVRPDGVIESKPIKGTIRRGATPAEDESLRQLLRTDVKSRAENLMIVDLVRNDLGRVCNVGAVTVPRLMGVDSYATVHQLVSTVRGRLRPDVTAVDGLQRAFPGGSMTGAPKIRTMALIDDLEPAARGVYSGALGYLSVNGAADLSIVIRTAVFRDGQVSIGTGGAIVALSERPAEFEEIVLKSRALIDAFRVAEGEASIRLD